MSNEIEKRLTIEDLFKIKQNYLDNIKTFYELDRSIALDLEVIKGHIPYRLTYNYKTPGKHQDEKHIDRICWEYLVELFQLEKYMLCTDYETIKKEIEEEITPPFTIEIANKWLEGLKDQIYDNIYKLVKDVYSRIIIQTYRTGSSGSAIKKKRNNNGIDESFILSTNDYQMMFTYWGFKPTITDDFEKCCYLLNGEKVPEVTIKNRMRRDKLIECDNAYFKIKVCQNGNTHYKVFPETRQKLNLYGPKGNEIGQAVKIKIFERGK